jgi:hypothetical protein
MRSKFGYEWKILVNKLVDSAWVFEVPGDLLAAYQMEEGKYYAAWKYRGDALAQKKVWTEAGNGFVGKLKRMEWSALVDKCQDKAGIKDGPIGIALSINGVYLYYEYEAKVRPGWASVIAGLLIDNKFPYHRWCLQEYDAPSD